MAWVSSPDWFDFLADGGDIDSMKSIWLMYHDIYETEVQSGISNSASMYHTSREAFADHLAAIKASGRPVITPREYRNGSTRDSVLITFDDGWRGAFEIGLPLLQSFGWKATFFITRDFVGREPFCDKEMILRAFDAGMEIGVHGTTHRMLLPCSIEEIEWELESCKTFLEKLLGTGSKSASVPGGAISPEIIACAKRLGFKSLCTSNPGVNFSTTSPFTLGRIAIRNKTIQSDIKRYCRYQIGPEIVRWALFGIPRRILGIRNYSALRRWLKGDKTTELFQP